jgi:hypothetical protein
MDPPPRSLEALMRKRPGGLLTPSRRWHWSWLALLIVIIGGAMYYLGLRR